MPKKWLHIIGQSVDSYQTCWPLNTVKQSIIKQIHELTNNQMRECTWSIIRIKIKNWNIIQNIELIIIQNGHYMFITLILFTNQKKKKKECNIVAIFQRKDTVQSDTRFNTYFVIFLMIEYTWDCTFHWRECNADECNAMPCNSAD